MNDIRVLLIQARTAPAMIQQEQECFAERTRLAIDQFVPVNVVHDDITPSLIADHDAVMIGGAGEFSACNDYPWMPGLLALVQACVAQNVPLMGSCWGHQVIARALGGEVIHDPSRAEFGCKFVTLTDAGETDPLLRDFPARFRANQGHHDRVSRLPEGGVELACSETQPNQAFRIAGKPVYGTQFHSELDADRERERLLTYRENYRSDLPDEAEFQAVLDSLATTTEVDHLLYDFVRKFVLNPTPA